MDKIEVIAQLEDATKQSVNRVYSKKSGNAESEPVIAQSNLVTKYQKPFVTLIRHPRDVSSARASERADELMPIPF